MEDEKTGIWRNGQSRYYNYNIRVKSQQIVPAGIRQTAEMGKIFLYNITEAKMKGF